MQPWVLRKVFEIGANQVADGDQMAVSAITASTRLGCLHTAIEPFGKAIGEAGAEVFKDAISMLPHRCSKTFEGCQSAATGPADPSLQQLFGLRHVGGRGEHLAQRLLDCPRTCRLEARSLQPVHMSHLFGRPLARVFERAPANAFQVRLVLDLGASNLIERCIGQRNDMEGIEADLGIGTVFASACLVGRAKVQADVRDGLSVTTVGSQIVGKGLKCRRIPTLRGEQQSPLIHVAEHRQEPLPLVSTALVGANTAHVRVVLLGTGRFNVKVQDPPNAVTGNPQQLGHRVDRHLRAKRHHKGLQRLREAHARARPRHLRLRRLPALAAAYTRDPGLNDGPILEEVQMLPGTRKAVVNRLVIGPASGACQPLGCVLNLEHDAALQLLEINIDHVPWRGQPECLCEECVHQQMVPSAGAPGKRASMGRIHTKRERALEGGLVEICSSKMKG